MAWMETLKGDGLGWLLETGSPGVRYLALRDLCDGGEGLAAARRAAHREGPIAAFLDAMETEGYWSQPGPGYRPKYRSTVWATIALAQLGADPAEDDRIPRACAYLLDQALTPMGQFSVSGTPSQTIDCLQGNMCWALTELGCRDERLDQAYDWMARSVTGDGIAPKEDKRAPLRYYAYQCGPDFACGANYGQPCAWGAVKVLGAFGALPAEKRTPRIEAAIRRGLDFLLGTDPAEAEYPHPGAAKPSLSWWKFGFPLFYVTDLLQNATVLAQLGCGQDPRLANVLDRILEAQDDQGRWPLTYSYSGKTWFDFGPKRAPNEWVTYRALRLFKLLEG